MKVRVSVLAAGAVAVAIAAGGASAKSPAPAASAAAGSCTASIAMEGPFTAPLAPLGLEQWPFAELAVATANKKYGMNVTITQDDTQLTPSIATTKTQSIISSSAVAAI